MNHDPPTTFCVSPHVRSIELLLVRRQKAKVSSNRVTPKTEEIKRSNERCTNAKSLFSYKSVRQIHGDDDKEEEVSDPGGGLKTEL